MFCPVGRLRLLLFQCSQGKKVQLEKCGIGPAAYACAERVPWSRTRGGMTYSIIGILAFIILLIINKDVL